MNDLDAGIGMTSQRTRLRMVERLRERGVKDEIVLAAIAQIARHKFVDEALASRAYEDIALPIGFGQTMSSPYLVARMVEIARGGEALARVLDIGTGCGYQAAVLSRIAREVYSIERVAALATKARVRLRRMRIHNVKLRHGDGHRGLPEAAPFDAVVMAAAATHLPEALLAQLTLGGRLVFPLGTREQRLCCITRTQRGYDEVMLDEVKFVPLLPGTA
jgi:protein-L-isoaspartate(D-aspartate) O-methyltransferase